VRRLPAATLPLAACALRRGFAVATGEPGDEDAEVLPKAARSLKVVQRAARPEAAEEPQQPPPPLDPDEPAPEDSDLSPPPPPAASTDDLAKVDEDDVYTFVEFSEEVRVPRVAPGAPIRGALTRRARAPPAAARRMPRGCCRRAALR